MDALLLRLFLVGILVLGARVGAAEFPGADGRWRHWRSPNFEVYSRTREAETRELLRSLELLRAAFLDGFKLKERMPLPVTAYLFDTEKLFRAYKPASFRKETNFRGFYAQQPDRAFIVMGPGDGADESRAVIFHEFVHHLVRVSGEEPPPWYNEGIAELFSSIEVHPDHLAFGRPHPGRVAELQLAKFLPLEQLFGTTYQSPLFREGKHAGVFYSQSWALMHFCHFGSTKLPRESLEQFLRIARTPRLSADPEQLRAICRELLGLDFPELNRELERYMRSGKYSWGKLPLPAIAPPASYTVRPVLPAEMAVRLADLQLRVERAPAAKLALILAAERAPQDARLQETLGAAARVEGDEAGARDRWRRAVALGSSNPAVFHQLALLETRRWFQLFDLDFRMPDQTAADLRDLLKRSIAAAPEQSDAYEMLAWIEATAREPDIANVNLVQSRYPTLKDKPRTLLALAMLRWRKDDAETAVKLLDALRAMEPTESVRQAAEHLRAAVENRGPALTLLPGPTRGQAPPVRVPQLRPSGEVTLPPR